MANIPENSLPSSWMYDQVSVETFEAEKVQLYVQQAITKAGYEGLADHAKVRTMHSYTLDQMIFQLTSWCAAGRVPDMIKTQTIEYPDGPWQTLKEAYAPGWLKSKFPVRMKKEVVKTQVNHYFVCPHLSVPDNDRDVHIRFMMTARKSADRPW